MNRIPVGIYGAAGYTGQELLDLLGQHPGVELIFATSESGAGTPVSGANLTYIKADDAPLDRVRAVFLALPHLASAPTAAKARIAGVKTLDLSADLRLRTPESYQQWYHAAHPNPELLPAPYGLVEVNRALIAEADLVAVPGCYPTATLLGLYPLLEAAALESGAPIIVDAKSGVSGAGHTPKPQTHFVEVFGNLTPYNTGRAHRHVGEIEQTIHQFDVDPGPLIFTPHLLPVDRGLMSSIYVTLAEGHDSAAMQALYEQTYADEPLVKVLPTGQQAALKDAVRTNRCVISLTPVTPRYLHITSVIDNLRKGASSQAIQCFNLMFGFTETTGLI